METNTISGPNHTPETTSDENLQELLLLSQTLADGQKSFSEIDKHKMPYEQKLDHVDNMKDYINQALANLAFNIIHATQKINDGLNKQTEDIESISRQVKEIDLELDIKKEMRNRVTIGELTTTKTKPWRSFIKVVDDHTSNWKKPKPKFNRKALDFTMLENVGVLGVKSSVGNKHPRKLSRTLSMESTASYNSVRGSTLLRHGEESRHVVGTLKRPALPVVRQPRAGGHNISIRLSTLPPMPDFDDMFTRQESIIEEETDTITQKEEVTEVDDEDGDKFDDALTGPDVSEEFDISTLPPPPPTP